MFEQFPYSNLHNLNLDWLLTKVKKLESEIQHIPAGQKAYLVTPQQFGAVGDGVTDDTLAWRNWERSTDGLKYIPSGDYVVDGISTHYDGQIGNHDSDVSEDPWAVYSAGLNDNNNLILNRRTASGINNTGDTAQIQLYEDYTYTDTTTEATENFFRGASIDSKMVLRGYTANRNAEGDAGEAPTQHIGNIVGTTYSYIDGLVGTSALLGRAYAYPGAYNATYGGNKIHALGSMTRNYVSYDAGGYALGAEIDMYNDVASDNGKYGYIQSFNYTRRYEGLVLACGGKAPGHTGMRLSKISTLGMYTGIKFGKTMHRINETDNTDSDNKNAGSDGHEVTTAGIDMRTWTPENRGKYALYLGHAHRHISSLGGLKLETEGAHEFIRSGNTSAIMRLVGAASEESGKYASIEFVNNATNTGTEHVYNYAGKHITTQAMISKRIDSGAHSLRITNNAASLSDNTGTVSIYPSGDSNNNWKFSHTRLIPSTNEMMVGDPSHHVNLYSNKLIADKSVSTVSSKITNIASKLGLTITNYTVSGNWINWLQFMTDAVNALANKH